jgi:phospholipase C
LETAVNAPLDRIEHIVVLMLENRSFNNMLGWLYDPHNPPPYDQPPRGQTFEGVSGKPLSNPIPAYAQDAARGSVPVGKATNINSPNPDPGEEYYHVNTQLYGTLLPAENRHKPYNHKPYNLPAPLPAVPPMNGFVTDYINTFTSWREREPAYDEYKVIMDGFTPDMVPVISALANQYAVCDHYHASVPSQTFCNRAFVHCAESHGFVVNAPYVNWLFTHAPTIFNRIQDARRPDLTWKVYYDELNLFALTWLLHAGLRRYHHPNFCYMEEFYRDARDGTLPSYSFIEPRLVVNHNDQHPPVDDFLYTHAELAGEQLIYDVYRAVRYGKGWDKTLLVITYDEHGGCYDHVPPPAAVPPHPAHPAGQYDFKFDRLGVRLPTILVSPYIEPGAVDHTLYDHTSIIKTVCNRWSLPHLTERDKAANDFSAVLTRDTPRRDDPLITPRTFHPIARPEDEPLNDFQRGVLSLVAGISGMKHVEEDKHVSAKVADLVHILENELQIHRLKTIGQAWQFMRSHVHLTVGYEDSPESKLE